MKFKKIGPDKVEEMDLKLMKHVLFLWLIKSRIQTLKNPKSTEGRTMGGRDMPFSLFG